MTVWIVTTGSSDVELKDSANRQWQTFRKQADNINEFQQCAYFNSPARDSKKKISVVPVRALGLVYASHEDNFATDLQFPLLDVLTPELQFQISQQPDEDRFPLRVIVLITDQRQLFQERTDGINDPDCPFWQDTYELRPILQWYFKQHLEIEPEFITLEPQGDRGIDHWDAMLTEVKNKLSELECSENEIVYVSHQAGTPAISSAVQFTTISQFNTVKFLVSNQFDQGCQQISYEAETIPSSNYWRSLQIQKAKKLIEKRLPSAALELLKGLVEDEIIEKLNSIVDIFNLKATGDNKSEFEPVRAIERVRQALDLAEIFFSQENYLPGVNVLAAAHETFLKAAIMYKIKQNKRTVNGFQVSQLLKWDNEGLSLQSKTNLSESGIIIPKNSDDLSKSLEFPCPEEDTDKKNNSEYSSADYELFHIKYLKNNPFTLSSIPKDNFFKPNESRLRKWLLKLDISFQEWELLKWSCTFYRTHELDLRNQNLHNLLGVKKIDVIRYLLGNPNDPKIKNVSDRAKKYYKECKEKQEDFVVKEVIDIYIEWVKKPFIKALESMNLIQEARYKSLQEQLDELASRIT